MMEYALLTGLAAGAAGWFGSGLLRDYFIRMRFLSLSGSAVQPFWTSSAFRRSAAALLGFLTGGFVFDWGLGAVGAGAVAGWGLCVRLEKEKRSAALRAFEKDLPLFLDFMGLTLSSGLSVADAIRHSAAALPPAALKSTLQEIFPERHRASSLRGGLERMKTAHPSEAETWSVFQIGLEKGVPLQDFVFSRAEAIRRKKMIELERRAQTIGLRLLFPILLFIFPAFFIALFGPIFLYAAQNGGFF